ncbi:uncharacterized protein KY384_008461 [Bacidia gigantensis]|uniref:uncharacterized protein n=1 Tax=Bacidia gigantensis TaxID=2732470 RepID=UPI001D056142|nr:uncharacterized protein KY384_008461 [Bacidia gigantensis]KAG8527032.1 hypothetical protein KY384_008461 [Bacidia gigantensis]
MSLLRTGLASMLLPRRAPLRHWISSIALRRHRSSAAAPVTGIATPAPEASLQSNAKSPFYFDTGYALFAKRPSRPFPPPFSSPPSGSFSDALSTHNRSRDRRPYVNGEMIRGITNGDDAVLVNEHFIGANDGVGAWASREKGHAALWSRLILHFWALEVERCTSRPSAGPHAADPDPVNYLQRAYEQTLAATSAPNEWNGTTTACAALIHHELKGGVDTPVLYVTNLGDSQCLVLRPKDGKDGDIIFKTIEQWHWFDCPRQLGTNSPDTPKANAALDKVEIEEGDVVLAMSDGVADNLWQHEILENVIDSMKQWDLNQSNIGKTECISGAEGGMLFVAKELVKATRKIAEDPYAESPFMERAVEEGLAMEGGKLDDISVVAAVCRKRGNG